MSDEPAVVAPPPHLWLVGRSGASGVPQHPSRSELSGWPGGNRFDSATGRFGVTYLGSTVQACLGESLSVLRPQPGLAEAVASEWREKGWMDPGSVAADWRQRRRVTKVTVASSRCFLNLESPQVMSVLDATLGATLAVLGYEHLDPELLHGPDRKVTAYLSDHIWQQTEADGQPRFAGIRYLSRHNSDWECWAVFEQTPLVPVELLTLSVDDPALAEVGALFGLQNF